MKGYEELFFMDALHLAALIKKKEIQPIELVDLTIENIEKVNPLLNAVVTAMYDEAREAARGPLPDGPFTGVPFLVKDLLASCRGVRMTMGTKNMHNYVAGHDSELVSRYRKSGLIIIGKTNTPELGLLPTTESKFLGPCRNPWNLNHTPGGSSGGSAAAVAAGMISAAHGNDGGGSIRIPASCCGIFGLKPTRARNSLAPDAGDLMGGFIAEHVLTRSVRDSATILDATCGQVIGDPYWAPPPTGPYKEEVGKKPGKLRIAYINQLPGGRTVAEDCRIAVRDAALLCQNLGHEVDEVVLDIDADVLARAFNVIWASGCAATIDGIAYLTKQKPSPEQYEKITWGLYEIGKKCTGADFLTAILKVQKIAREVATFFSNFDILLTPTLGEPPVLLGTFESPDEDPLQGWRRSGQFVPFTPLCNATGHPAMSVPLYWNEDGLPVGTHFVGRFGDEATLFRLAAQLEEARPWKEKKPPVSVCG